MTAITDKKLRDKLMKEKTLELKKTIELVKQNTYEKKNKKNTIPEALISTKEKQAIKEEPIQRLERFGTRPKNRTIANRPCRYCGIQNWTPMHKCPATETNCNNCGKKGHYAKVCRQKYTNNRTVKQLTEEEIEDKKRDIKRIRREHTPHKRNKEDRRKEQTLHGNGKINGIKKEFIIDTGSPITIMPPDEKILKLAELQKITNRCLDVNKNEVKFREKFR